MVEEGKKLLEEMEVEPWEPIETKLVKGTLIAGVLAMIVLAVLVHMFVLSHY